MVGPVEGDGGDGDVALADGPDVGVGDVGFHDDDSALPVVGAAPGVFSEFDAVFVDALAHADDLMTFYFWIGDGGDVDVEESEFGEVEGDEFVDVGLDPFLACFVVEGGSVGEDGHGEREGPNAVDGAFHGSGDGSGVGDIEAEIGAVVDAADYEVATVGPGDGEADVDAVDGDAVDHVGFKTFELGFAGFFDSEGVAHGHGVSASGTLDVGSDDFDFAEVLDRPHQREEALGMDAVVVGDQDTHGWDTTVLV